MDDYKAIMCDANNLYNAYRKSISSSRWKESTQRIEDNYLRVIFRLQKELENQTYHSKPCSEFILNERGKNRPITSLQTPDRIVRHVLCDDILLPRIRPKIIYDNGASLRGRGLSFTQRRFRMHIKNYIRVHGTNKGYIGFGDFTKFYDNIPHDKAKKSLLDICENDTYMDWLLSTIFQDFLLDCSDMPDDVYEYYKTHPIDRLEYRQKYYSEKGKLYLAKGVNIGDQLSQVIGIYYPTPMDNYIKIVRSQKYYDRYQDDFAIISDSKDELHDIFNGIHNEVFSLGLFLNEKKTRIVRLDRPFTFLKTRYETTPTGKVYEHVNPKTPIRLEQRLIKLHRKYEDGLMDYYDIEDMFKGEMGNIATGISEAKRVELMQLYERLFDSKITLIGSEMIIERRY